MAYELRPYQLESVEVRFIKYKMEELNVRIK